MRKRQLTMFESTISKSKNSKTFLVTGGAGFMGSEFIRNKLRNSKDKIIVLDFLTYAGNLDNLKWILNKENILLPLNHEIILNVIRNWEDYNNIKIRKNDEDFKRIKWKTEDYKINIVKLNELKERIIEILEKQNLAFVIGNIMDRNIVDILFSISDIVIHYAAETHVDRSILDADSFIKTDVYGTYILLETLRKNKNVKKFVHISTDEIYGPAPEGISFKETDPINPRNPYSASKASADRLCYAYYNTYKLPIVIVRPSNNYGPYQYPEKLISLMTIKAINNEYLPVYGDGRQRREWLYVEDCAEAINLIINKGKIGEVYNISSGEERENIEVVKIILKILNKSQSLIKYIKDRPGHDRRYSINWEKIKKLGWKPKTNLEEGLEKTVKWYQENQKWWQKIIKKSLEYKRFFQTHYGET